jgi:hypothetical protein
MRFDLIVADQVTGTKPLGLKLKEAVVIPHGHPNAIDAATELTMVKLGTVLAAELATQYVLPSGDVEPLTISRGNRRLRELEDLMAEIRKAPAESVGCEHTKCRCEASIAAPSRWTYEFRHQQATRRIRQGMQQRR